jgi:hypothetical protein
MAKRRRRKGKSLKGLGGQDDALVHSFVFGGLTGLALGWLLGRKTA